MSKTYEEYITKRAAMLTMDAVISMVTSLLQELKETKVILGLARTIEIEEESEIETNEDHRQEKAG